MKDGTPFRALVMDVAAALISVSRRLQNGTLRSDAPFVRTAFSRALVRARIDRESRDADQA